MAKAESTPSVHQAIHKTNTTSRQQALNKEFICFTISREHLIDYSDDALTPDDVLRLTDKDMQEFASEVSNALLELFSCRLRQTYLSDIIAKLKSQTAPSNHP